MTSETQCRPDSLPDASTSMFWRTLAPPPPGSPAPCGQPRSDRASSPPSRSSVPPTPRSMLGHEVVEHLLIAPFQEQAWRCARHVRSRLFADQPHAGRGAALDLVLQAGTAAVGEKTSPCTADAKQLLQLGQDVAHRAGTRKGSEVVPGRACASRGETQSAEIPGQCWSPEYTGSSCHHAAPR